MKLIILLIQVSIFSVQAIPIPGILSGAAKFACVKSWCLGKSTQAEKDILKNKQMAAYFQAIPSSNKAHASQIDFRTDSMTAQISSQAPVSQIDLITDSMGSKEVFSITPKDMSLQKDTSNLRQRVRDRWAPELETILESN
jgi:hypothetical protein